MGTFVQKVRLRPKVRCSHLFYSLIDDVMLYMLHVFGFCDLVQQNSVRHFGDK